MTFQTSRKETRRNKLHSTGFNYLVLLLLVLIVNSCSKHDEPSLTEIALNSTDGLRVGVAVADITPSDPIGVELEGYGNSRPSTGIHDTLTGRCLLLNDGHEIVALISLDLIGMFRVHIQQMKDQIIKETGLKAENIFIHSTHTHSGPPMLGDDRYNAEYRSRLYQQVTNAVVECFSTSQKSEAYIYSGNSTVGTVNRRYPEKEIANKFTCIEFTDSLQKTLCTLLNFGCHPVVLGPGNLQISADYPHYVRKRIETETDGTAMFFNSRFGDINPPPINESNVYQRSGGSFDMAKEMGEHLAEDMLNSRVGNKPLSVSLRTATKIIEIEQLQFTDRTEIAVLDLGEVQIVMLPGEPLEKFVEDVEAILPGPYPIIFGQTGDAIGYIVSGSEWESCSYALGASCYEETLCADISVASKLEAGYRELVNPNLKFSK